MKFKIYEELKTTVFPKILTFKHLCIKLKQFFTSSIMMRFANPNADKIIGEEPQPYKIINAPFLKTLRLHNFCLDFMIFLICYMRNWGVQWSPKCNKNFQF